MVTFNYVGYPMVREARAMIVLALSALFSKSTVKCLRRVLLDPFQILGPEKDGHEIPCVSLDLGARNTHGALPYFLLVVLKAAAEATYGDFREVIDTVNVIATCDPEILVNMMWTKQLWGQQMAFVLGLRGTR